MMNEILSHHSQFPSPLSSSLEDSTQNSIANFPIFHLQNATDPLCPYPFPFSNKTITYVRPGEAMNYLNSLNSNVNSFEINSKKRPRITNSREQLNYIQPMIPLEFTHTDSPCKLNQHNSDDRHSHINSRSPDNGCADTSPWESDYRPAYNPEFSPIASSIEDVQSKNSRKKQSVNPTIYDFTSQSSKITDPSKFDKAVISFLKSQGRPVIKMPSVDKKWLSFWSLFHAVLEFGGFATVTKSRKWKQVAHKLLLPPTLTSASYTLRTFYTRYLLEFEQYYHQMNGNLDVYSKANEKETEYYIYDNAYY